ncbi:hypothetical protein QBC42DRAFT_250630 [Cladorrhinum samala]|uniref:Uncharacterized protein n=1 Tax=Cladorrhinum samala TaxID=585594 RepID=A0AAV9HRE8_9PEZI|nr:hypothetical protein QBC42DRAFT_250630 [Cladorrhinum samala]
MAPAQSYNHRPSVSSPLSSPPPATGSARHSEFSFSHQRATQSSPVQQQHHQPQQQPFSSPPSQPANAKLFRYSQNPFRSGNPLTSVKRDQVRETKRKLFLANVRQRQEDKKWEKREDEVLKLEFYRLNRERKERLLRQQEEEQQPQQKQQQLRGWGSASGFAVPEEEEEEEEIFLAMRDGQDDSKMVDVIEEMERCEVDALLEGLEKRQQQGEGEDDDYDDYDELFMEIIGSQQQDGQQQQQQHQQGQGQEDDVEMS